MQLKHDVYGSGLLGEILVLGEAPGKDEVAQGEPFVGASGKLLRSLLVEAGISPTSVRFENVCERKLNDNDFTLLYLDAKQNRPTEELVAWYYDLAARVSLVRPKAIIACGEQALRAVTNLRGIANNHCYVLVYKNDKAVPVVPVYHPAFVLRLPEMGVWLKWGLTKTRRMLEKNIKDHIVRAYLPSFYSNAFYFSDVYAVLQQLQVFKPRISVDIETTTKEPYQITCLSIATSEFDSICIPFATGEGNYWTVDQEAIIWKELAKVLEDPKIAKVFQNYIFDCMWFSKYGIDVKGRIDDTMVIANLINPELKKGLADLGRLYVYGEPWKESRDWGLGAINSDFWKYNATDAYRTYEIFLKQLDELHEKELRSFYDNYVQPLYEPVLRISEQGLRVDRTALSPLQEKLRGELEPVLKTLQELAAQYLKPEEKVRKIRKTKKNPEGGQRVEFIPRLFNPASPKQVKEVLNAQGIKLPTKDRKETTDERALLRLQRKYPSNKLIPLLLSHREVSKLLNTYAEVSLDEDERFRSAYNIAGTKSGRLSSSQTPWFTGGNAQNIPRTEDTTRSIRDIFVPDEGKVFVSIDLSQAEARVVAWLAKEEKLVRLLEEGADIHTYTANLIYNQDITKLPEKERKLKRYLGKKANHSYNYGKQARSFVDDCLLETGLVLELAESEYIRRKYFEAYPHIQQWHRSVEDQVRTTRKLVSPHGRVRHFLGRMNEDLFREAYSFVPQATVVDTLNQGWLKLAEHKDLMVVQQGHDSLLIQVDKEKLEPAINTLCSVFNGLQFNLNGKICRIPFDIQVGTNWRDLAKWKG